MEFPHPFQTLPERRSNRRGERKYKFWRDSLKMFEVQGENLFRAGFRDRISAKPRRRSFPLEFRPTPTALRNRAQGWREERAPTLGKSRPAPSNPNGLLQPLLIAGRCSTWTAHSQTQKSTSKWQPTPCCAAALKMRSHSRRSCATPSACAAACDANARMVPKPSSALNC